MAGAAPSETITAIHDLFVAPGVRRFFASRKRLGDLVEHDVHVRNPLVSHTPTARRGAGETRSYQARAPWTPTDCTRPTVKSCTIIDEEPKLMKGSGIPVMGIRERHIPMFSKIWNVHIATIPKMMSLPNSISHR